jgi:hypothetical protein
MTREETRNLIRDLIREMAFYGRYIPQQEIEPEQGDPSDWGARARSPVQRASASKKLAYMSSAAWERKAQSTYKDVEMPIAIIPMPDFTGEATDYPEGESRAVSHGRVKALADRVFRSLGVDPTTLPSDLLTIIVTSPEYKPQDYKRISSPWTVIHALFDDEPTSSLESGFTGYTEEIFDLIDRVADCYDSRPSSQFLTHAMLSMGSARDYNIKNLSDSAAEIITHALLKPEKFEVRAAPPRVVSAAGGVANLVDPDTAASLQREIYARAREIASEIWPRLAGQTILVRA